MTVGVGGGTGERDWETWGEKREIEIPGERLID